jgi:hypothetical protein
VRKVLDHLNILFIHNKLISCNGPYNKILNNQLSLFLRILKQMQGQFNFIIDKIINYSRVLVDDYLSVNS